MSNHTRTRTLSLTINVTFSPGSRGSATNRATARARQGGGVLGYEEVVRITLIGPRV